MLSVTGADMVMGGRGAFGNPWIFREILAALEGAPCRKSRPAGAGGNRPPPVPAGDGAQGRARGLPGGEKALRLVSAGVAHSGYFKEQIAKIETMDDIDRITEGIKRELR